MTNAERFCRLSTRVAATACLLVGIIIWTIVLPSVRADTFARATPDRAATAFKVVLFLFELLAVALTLISLRITRRGIVGGIVTCGIIVLVLSLLLLDAANSYRAHGPDLRVADEFLYGCFVVALLVSILLFVVAFVLRKGRKELQVSSTQAQE
jgi:hypothetical protein